MPVSPALDPSTASTPLELLGANAGLSVVDPGTILTRLWYFDGKFLRAAGFRLDQEYVRSLVALSNQAGGSGVVHGFDVARAGGDRLRVTGGLALAPSGRVVYLPQQVELSIADLIARSTGTFDPSDPPPPGVGDFSTCPPDEPAGPDVTVAGRPLYVLTVAGIEALCGEEERFGQLCEDACATETDRSKVVEGVNFRVRELALALPTSTAVPFTNLHLRSRVASAFFELERRAVPSMISGAGLRNPVWCAAAPGIGGEEVALAVFDRGGAVTTLVDMWTARRELMEPSARRYWAWRMAMRPWDVFLAQVLQFQCQLLDLGEGGGGGGVVDPCADERDALVEVDAVLQSLATGPGPGPGTPFERLTGAVGLLSPDAFSRIEAVRAKITAALATGTSSSSGSLLVDGGIVEVPAAGYLPTSLQADVAEQVRALFGPGVDLRFCAVRPDFVPEALLEAQHMERISLTRGLDDPARLEEVDVLVPDGELSEQPVPATSAFVGVGRIQPRVKSTGLGLATGSALSLSVVGRDSTAAGWSWTLAAYGEAAQQLSVTGLLRGTLLAARRAFRGDEVGTEGTEPVELFIRPDADHDRRRLTASFGQRVLREGRNAAVRKARLLAKATPFEGRGEPAFEEDRGLAAGEDRPVAIWLDGETSVPLDTLPMGGTADARLRASLYSRAATNPVLADVRATGTLRVVDILTLGSRRVIRTLLDGVGDVMKTGDQTELVPIRSLPLNWIVGVLPTGARILAVTAGDPPAGSVSFIDTGQPRHIGGDAMLREPSGPVVVTPEWQPAAALTEAIGVRDGKLTPFASLELDEEEGALAPGAAGRTLAESVISVIGAELAVTGRDPTFVAYATDRLLTGTGAGGGPTAEVRATRDWVLFHRRRTRTCVGETVERPPKTRTYRLFHRKFDDGDLRGFEALRGRFARSAADGATAVAVDDLGFDPVATLEFREGSAELQTPASVLRTSWQAGDRGTRLVLGAVGDLGEGDGETVALGRLATVRSVLGDLVDSSQARLEYLLEIPPEFREPGLDGVLFTVGVDEAVKACITLYRLSRAEHKRVLDQLRQVGDTVDIPTVLRQVDATADVFTVELEGDEVVDHEARRAEWDGFDVLFGVLGLRSSAGDPAIEAWRNRSRRVADVIGTDDVADEHVIVQTGECDAVLLVAAEARIG